MSNWEPWLSNDEYTHTYRWEYNFEDFPESIKINEFVNDQLREIMNVKEDIVRKAAIAILRAKGYVVIDPPKPSGHVHEKWQLQECAKGGKYCAACGEDVKGEE